MVLHSNTDFIILAILVHFLTIPDVNHGYALKCPQAVHWNVRSKDMCITELKYVCLYDDVKTNITESCDGPLPTIAKGYTWLVRGNPDRGSCSPGTYQPTKHRNVKSSDCVYKKSTCSEDGQVVFDTGNTTDDQTCRCDYRKGYDFVETPRNRCYCHPLEEDCSCYKRQCDNIDTSLSPDFQCIENKDNHTLVCLPIKAIPDKGFLKDLVIRHKHDKDVGMNWFKTVLQILVICTIVMSCVSLVVSQKCQKSQYLHRAPNGFSVLENDDCSITFEWCRDNSIDIQEYEFLHRRQGTVDWAVLTISIDDVVEQINGSLMYEFKNLLPETNYEMKICSVSGNKKSQYTESKIHKTQHNEIFASQLKSQKCCFGEDVKFECTLIVNVDTACWLKDQKESEVPCHWKTKSDCGRKHNLTINAVSFEDEGLYSVNVMNSTSKAMLGVEDKLLFRSEDIHYILSVHAICKIAIPAFRDVFDKHFPHESLSNIIHTHKRHLVPLLKTNHITSEQWRLLLHDCTSQKFGLRLMIFLLRHVANLDIENKLPNAGDKSELADLSRIDYYRNMTAHYHGRMSDTDFKQCLKDIMEAAHRLTDVQNEKDCHVDRIMTKPLINHESDKLTLEIEALLQTESEEIQNMISYISTEERNFMRIVYLLHAVACPTVRYKLNTICSHADLQRKLQSNKQTKLSSLKEEFEITPSQWKLLFPDIGKTSSKDFGLKLMRILIFELELSPVKKAETQALLSLESYVHTLARSNSGRVSDENFNDYWNDICEAIIQLGGDLCTRKRFKNICCFLRMESTDYLETLCSV